MTKKKEKIEILDKKGKVLGEGLGTLKKTKDNGKTQVLFQTASLYKGPLPPASELEKYKKINSRLVSCIVNDFERNSKLREELNKKALEAQISLDKKSQNQGFVASILMILGAIICAYYKQTIIGSALVGVSAFGIIKAILPNKEK